MTQIIEAIYEDGILRLLKPLKGIKEHSKVKITIEAEKKPKHLLADCIGILPDEDAAEMRRIIEEEFENNPWIAALCMEHSVPLATEDAHFSEVGGLTVEKR